MGEGPSDACKCHSRQAGRHRNQRLWRDRAILPANRRGVGHVARSSWRQARPQTVGRQPQRQALAPRTRFGDPIRRASWANMLAAVKPVNGANRWIAEWVPNVASALSWSSKLGHGVGHSPWPGSRPKLQAQSFRGTLAPRSAHPCCPCGATKRPGKLRPCGAVSAVTWTHQRMRAGVHVLSLADQWWFEAWGAWTLQSEWPLHLTAGLETWRLEGSPNMPSEGLRWRVGVSHTLVMSPGRPTFAPPCCP